MDSSRPYHRTAALRLPNRREFIKLSGGFVASSVLSNSLPLQERPGAPVRPNILLFFPDQLRFDWIGSAGTVPVHTPNLDWLGARGVQFRRTVTPSPLCAPARACLASGMEYERCRVPSNGVDYPLGQTTIYSILRASGYRVAGCGKFDLHKATLDWGLDGKRLLNNWGFSDGIDNAGKEDAVRSGSHEPHDPYMAYLYGHNLASIHLADFAQRHGGLRPYSVTSPTALPEEAYCDNWVATRGLKLLDEFPRGSPWYLGVNFVGPHSPMDITTRMEKLVRGRQFPQPNSCRVLTPEIHLLIRENYSAMVENIDRCVGIYLEKLRQRGEMKNTLIVFSSDHGDMLGDHNHWAKSVPYQPSVGVPLIISGPGVKSGIVSDALTSTLDLAATFLDYAGVPKPAAMDSYSLRPVLEGKTRNHREFVRSGLGSWRMAWDGRYKLVRGFDPRQIQSANRARQYPALANTPPPLLFDLERDPLEHLNQAQSHHRQVRRLDEILKFSNPPSAPG